MILISPLLRLIFKILSFILFGITILAAYSGRVDPELSTFPATLVLALPWLAIASALTAIAWFCTGRVLTGGVGVLALICCWGPVSTVIPLSTSKKASPGAETFRIMSWNIAHGVDKQYPAIQYNRTLREILESDADIICLQEILKFVPEEVPHLTGEVLDSIRKKYPYIIGQSYLDSKVLSKYPISYIPANRYITGNFEDRPHTFYLVHLPNHDLTVVNVHLTSFMLNAEQQKVFTGMTSAQGIKEGFKDLKGGIREKLHKGFTRRKSDAERLREALDRIEGPVVVCGDFNDVPESYTYRLVRGDDMRDAYVETGFGPLVTFNQHLFWVHLDQILYRGPLKALSVKRGHIKSSDHYPLIAEFEFTANSDGK